MEIHLSNILKSLQYYLANIQIGERLDVTLNEGVCYNLPSEWNDRASRLTTPSQMCLDVYENVNCLGKHQHYPAGYAMFVELGGTEFNDFISSFGVSSRGKNGCAES